MNKVKVVYPADYDDDDKAEYDTLIAFGQSAIGVVINKNDKFLLDLAAKMTIRERKGGLPDLTKEQIEQLRAIHNEHLKIGLIHETPPNEWYTSAENPINQPYIPEDVDREIKKYDEEYKKSVCVQ